MGHHAELLVFCCVLSSAAACNALTGADALEADERASSASSSGTSSSTSSASSGQTTASSSGSSGSTGSSSSSSSSGAASSGSTSSSGASGTVDSGVPPTATVVINETFDTSCGGGWTAVNGVFTPDGAGGCVLCATSPPNVYVETTVTATRNGTASMEAWVKRRQATTTPTNVSLTLMSGGSTVSASGAITADSYTKLSPGKASAQSGASITPRISIGSAAADDCIVLDAVRVIID